MTITPSPAITALVLVAGLAQEAGPGPPARQEPPAVGTVIGQVVDQDGAPFPFADVFLEATEAESSFRESALTDETGRFRFEAVPAEVHRLHADAQGFTSTRHEHVLVTPGRTLRYVIELLPAARPKIRSVGTVIGRVVDQDGAPFPFADVFLEAIEAESSFQDSVLADDTGRFRFEAVPAGVHQLYAYAHGFTSTRHEHVWVTPGSPLRYLIELTPAEELAEDIEVYAQVQGMVQRRVQDLVALHGGVTRNGSSDSVDISIGGGPMPPVAYPTAGFEPPPRNREGYDHHSENRFRVTARSPLSTFSVDVDTASYSNVRRILGAGSLPPRGAVRLEELLNYFEHDDAGPTGDVPFAVHSEVGACPWAPDHRLVRIALQGRKDHELQPKNLVFLVDVSGSMRSSDKLPLVQESLELLSRHLTPGDTVGLVTYAGAAGVVLEPTSDRTALTAAIRRLAAGGSTAGGAGIEAAYRLAREHFRQGGVNRVVLCTDGDFNVGVSSQSGLVDLIERERESGVFLTVLGFGTGNLQDARMEQLADHGNGQYGYVDSLAEAERMLVRRLSGTLVPIAKDVKLQVEMNPARVAEWRLVGYENRQLETEDFDDDRKDAGEIGAGHSVIALYEIVPVETRRGKRSETDAASFALRYQREPELTRAASSEELMAVKLRWKEPDETTSRLTSHVVRDEGASLQATSDDFRFDAAVAGFGQLLHESEHVGELTWAETIRLANGARGADPHREREGFVELARTAERLAAQERSAPAGRP